MGLAGELVLVVGSAALRSALIARLGLAGETFRTAEGLTAGGITNETKQRAFLVVDTAILPGPVDGWDGHLADGGWSGPVAVLVTDACDPPAARITLIDASGSFATIASAVRGWRDGHGPAA